MPIDTDFLLSRRSAPNSQLPPKETLNKLQILGVCRFNSQSQLENNDFRGLASAVNPKLDKYLQIEKLLDDSNEEEEHAFDPKPAKYLQLED